MLIMRKIERFLRHHDMAPTTFGRFSVGDPRLVHDMRRGRQFRADMERRIEAYIAAYEADRGQVPIQKAA
jgi:hypothetical protein